MDTNYRGLLLCTAICSFLGAITTALLIFLPDTSSVDPQNTILLFKDRLYITKLWIMFFNPQLNFVAALGVAILLFRKHPLEIIIGTFFLLVWVVMEMSQQALLIDALNQQWRPAYLAAEEQMGRDIYLTLIKGTNALSDSKYFVLLYAFALGSLLYGLAMIREQGLAKWIGFAFLLLAMLGLAAFMSSYLGFENLAATVAWCDTWVYPYLQPVTRLALGIWILSRLDTLPSST